MRPAATLAALVALCAALSGCGGIGIATRNAPAEPSPVAVSGVAEAASFDFADAIRVAELTVRVPRSLKASEANRFLPRGDIVWREDPPGNRHAQVEALMQAAMERGVADLDGAIPVSVDVEVTRFHALSEKARLTVGGVHAISFILSVRDAQTGEVLMPPREVFADLPALGGRAALAAVADGQTQRVRISAHLAEVIRVSLTDPEGYRNATHGFLRLLNYI